MMLFMAALWNRTDHYIFAMWFLSSFFLCFFFLSFFLAIISAVGDWMSTILPYMVWPWCEFRMQVWNVLHVARWKCRTQESPKIHHLCTIAKLISSQLRHISTIGKKGVKQQCLPTCSHNMVNFGSLAAEICRRVWGTPANFNGFRVLAALLHSTLVVGVSQTLRRWTEGATYIRQGGHHVGHWPTFLVYYSL